ncbi:MAG: C13 family peptidase [Aquabacterium sp.]
MTDIDTVQQPAPQGSTAPQALPSGALGAWWWQGLRSALFLKPQWTGLQTTPQLVALMLLLAYAAKVGMERLTINGPADFYWASLVACNWFGTVIALWVCWRATRRGPVASAEDAAQPDVEAPPGVTGLFAMMVAQGFMLTVLSGLAMLPVYRDDDMMDALQGRWQLWLVWGVPMAWHVLAQIRLLWLSGAAGWRARLSVAAMLIVSVTLQAALRPPQHWYPPQDQQDAAADDDSGPPPLALTQELLEAQPKLLDAKLRALTAGPVDHAAKGRVAPKMFAITYAPYADADVFAHESQVVATLMQERFQTTGRTMQLINNRATVEDWPWATPLNLQRTIHRMAQLMDRDRDILFIHLTSHGARDGELATAFDPLTIDPVTPEDLKQWLDEAGIKWRVISISACFSGSWVPLLADDDTLVMTAADADHTSYGCGQRSPLTFFGRAMYEEQLRQTFSFEQAHAAARKVIEQREIEAGKDDGYSNPQIKVGEAARGKLAELEASLKARH